MGGAVSAVGDAFSGAANIVSGVVDTALSNPVATAGAIGLGVATGGFGLAGAGALGADAAASTIGSGVLAGSGDYLGSMALGDAATGAVGSGATGIGLTGASAAGTGLATTGAAGVGGYLASGAASDSLAGVGSYLGGAGAAAGTTAAATGGGLFGTGLTASQLASGVSAAGTLASGVSGLVGGNTTSPAAADPYAAYRSADAAKLQQLINNPSLTLSQPGYQLQLQQGMQQAQRVAMASGAGQSGAEQIALMNQGQGTFSNYYNTMLANLMQTSGASTSPASGAVAAANVASANQKTTGGYLSQVGQGVGGLASIYNTYMG